ncbi:MAG: DUF5107 domain-containing protein [Chitinophagales bacterium]
MQRITKSIFEGLVLIQLENEVMTVDLFPEIGGKISSIFNKNLRHEFLWRNKSLKLRQYPPGSEYDPHFFGGMDELLPNDIPESIDQIDYPDHGELWTTALQHKMDPGSVTVFGKLKLSGIFYSKTVSLIKGSPMVCLDYIIRNESSATRHFLWKMHAALVIEPGDRMNSHARKAKVADPAYSRFKTGNEFDWPDIENRDASIVPVSEDEMDFFYLYDIPKSEMQMKHSKGHYTFGIDYDQKIFPCQWYFASYGGFSNHQVAILEPATGMPLSVNEAISLDHCAALDPGEEINTRVYLFAGEETNYFPHV